MQPGVATVENKAQDALGQLGLCSQRWQPPAASKFKIPETLLSLDSIPSLMPSPDNPGYDPQRFVEEYIEWIFSGSSSIQVASNGDEGGVNTFAENIENDPNQCGPPPTARSALEALPSRQVSAEMVSGDKKAYCVVCVDAFEIGDEAMWMPCKHFYHKNCIVPWLKLHNSCPVCRHELPTDNPNVLRDMRAADASGGRRGGTSNF
ncbi:E3 ubiquitin-protein ligase RING1-like [Phalaenopsis equestris]|uniref:E3 ubiquitin-protein ligase RING1-like n=1 Tax=Phalaenopsis equestris TaxID=78828 RepID=UPI0009E63004|nr:E3 ubiquitin-protein ligase RING1-like [Phalaenopsis equestris]